MPRAYGFHACELAELFALALRAPAEILELRSQAQQLVVEVRPLLG
jgi:hypothetical protein